MYKSGITLLLDVTSLVQPEEKMELRR